MTYIRLENINKYFGNNHVLKDINLTINKGDFVTLLGPSGCGKSTLLRCLAGLESISDGKVYLESEIITDKDPKDRKIGMIFQQYSLFPNMSVFENIAFGLKMQKISQDEIESRVAESIKMVELNGKEKQYPSQLSGGQQQRVALARAIVVRPKVLLLDEPLSAIDAKLRKSLRTSIKEIHKELNITSVFVTHDQDEAMIMSDIIHLFNNGVIEQSGEPVNLYTAPRTRFAAGFIGNYNIISSDSFFRLTGESGDSSSDISIRPETIEISNTPFEKNEDNYYFTAKIKEHILHGNVLRYTITTEDVTLKVDVLFRSFKLFEDDSTVYISIGKHNCLQIC